MARLPLQGSSERPPRGGCRSGLWRSRLRIVRPVCAAWAAIIRSWAPRGVPDPSGHEREAPSRWAAVASGVDQETSTAEVIEASARARSAPRSAEQPARSRRGTRRTETDAMASSSSSSDDRLSCRVRRRIRMLVSRIRRRPGYAPLSLAGRWLQRCPGLNVSSSRGTSASTARRSSCPVRRRRAGPICRDRVAATDDGWSHHARTASIAGPRSAGKTSVAVHSPHGITVLMESLYLIIRFRARRQTSSTSKLSVLAR